MYFDYVDFWKLPVAPDDIPNESLTKISGDVDRYSGNESWRLVIDKNDFRAYRKLVYRE